MSVADLNVVGQMRWKWVLTGFGAVAVLVLAYAWLDAGRETMHLIVEPVPVPENGK